MLKRKKLFSFLLSGALVLPLASCSTTLDPFAQFTAYAKQSQVDWQVPGMSIAIVENGQIVYAQGFGERNAKGDPVTADTIFDIASLTKSFTAALLALQVDEGRYTWDTPVRTLYPQFQVYDSKTSKEFAVRDLIAHDSGLPADALDGLGNFGYSAKANMDAVPFIKPVAPFRSVFAYQDVFLEFARQIIQDSSGESYTTNLHQYMFDPLGMNNSYARTEPILNQLTNVAQPFQYYLGQNYPYPKDSPYLTKMWALDPGLAGGGIQSSAVDIAKWLLFNMNNGLAGNVQSISTKNMDYIHSPQTVITRSASGAIEQAYGEGWYIDKQEYAPYTVLYHPGGGTGTHAFMAYIPEKKIGIVILTNQWGNKVPEALYQKFFDLYFHRSPMLDWNALYLQQSRPNVKNKFVQADPCQDGSGHNLEKYIGNYYNPVYGNLVIAPQGNEISLSIGPQHMLWQLSYCQNDLLQAHWPNPSEMPIPMLGAGQDLINFTENNNQKIQSMTIPYLNDDGSGTFQRTGGS